jgi:hypothetical protein
MNKSILKTVAVSAVSAVAVMFCVGCSEKEDDSELEGDWSLVSEQYENSDGDKGGGPVPDNEKVFYSFRSSQVTATGFHKISDFWVESNIGRGTFSIIGGSLCIADEDEDDYEFCMKYSISGNTLTLSQSGSEEDCYDGECYTYSYSSTMTFEKKELAAFKSSTRVLSRNPLLDETTWYKENGDGYGDRIHLCSPEFEDEDRNYISSYNNVWYNEGNHIIILELGCDRYETVVDYDGYGWERCVSYSTGQPVTLEYQLSGGTLRLRPVGSTDWDLWTSYEYNKKSRAKSKKDKHSVGRFQAFRR